MFRIGEFSRFTRVTVKMLRHYDDLGLLKPAFVDSPTGYRYYLAEQLTRLNRIIALKDLGFSLDDIALLLDEGGSPERKARLFADRREALEQAIRRETTRLRQLDGLRSGANAAGAYGPYDVVLRAVPTCRMATIRGRVPCLGEPITTLFERLEGYVGRYKARASASPLMIFHDQEFRETDLDIEVAVPVTRAVPEIDDIRVREVEGCATTACVIYRGAYEQTSAVLQTLLAWTELHSMRIAGPIREVYLHFGADQQSYRLPSAFVTQHADEWVTEVQLPVERGEAR